MRLLRFTFALIPGLALAASVPAIQGVVDSAGYGPRVAPGSLASLFGTNLASATAAASGFPLATSLGGATVSVGGTLAPLLYVSPTQINFQVPSSPKTGAVAVVVKGPGGSSAAFNATVSAEAPAIYQYGNNHALAQNAGGTLNADSAAAASGSVITVYLTGQGAVTNSVTDGAATPLTPLSTARAGATATIGPLNAPIQFLGLTPEFAGLAQANIQVPALPTGDYPLVITEGGLLSVSVVVSVSGPGTAYTSPLTLAGSVAFANSSISNVVLFDNVAYVCGAGRIVMVDVTNPAAPSTIGEFGDSVLNGVGRNCTLNASAATPFLVEILDSPSASQESLAVFSLASPQSPTLLTVASTTWGQMADLSFSGNYGIATTSYITFYTSNEGVAAQTGDLLVFDFTNPGAPVFVTAMQPSTIPGSGDQNLKPWVNVVDGLYAYVASSTATGTSTAGAAILDVINIASPVVPSPIAQVTVPQAAILLSFDISGTTLLAAGNTTGQRNPGSPDFDFLGNLTLTAMDLTNVQAPAVVSTLTTPLQVNGTFATAGFANGVFAIVNNPPATDDAGPASLMIADARTPTAIALYPFRTQFGFRGLLTTSGGYLLAPTSLGLDIYQLQLQ